MRFLIKKLTLMRNLNFSSCYCKVTARCVDCSKKPFLQHTTYLALPGAKPHSEVAGLMDGCDPP
jgi:hypothetical protein